MSLTTFLPETPDPSEGKTLNSQLINSKGPKYSVLGSSPDSLLLLPPETPVFFEYS